jgi:hypothetical protein
MIMTNKIVAVALITALVGASLGAAVMHSRDTAQTTETATTIPDNTPTWNNGRDVRYTAAMDQRSVDQRIPSQFNTTEQQSAYKVGFSDGYQACGESRNVRVAQSGFVRNSGVVYRNAPYRSSATSRRVYYDYSRPRGRSFWSKHRDKLTMAIGTGAGALIGGLVGGKKGAGIGSLAGLGGSALYTYKLRKRNRRY